MTWTAVGRAFERLAIDFAFTYAPYGRHARCVVRTPVEEGQESAQLGGTWNADAVGFLTVAESYSGTI